MDTHKNITDHSNGRKPDGYETENDMEAYCAMQEQENEKQA